MSAPFGITGKGPDLYDRIGRTYAGTRRPDPRIAAAIWDALGDARSVLNVGAGAGNYEPPDRDVVALEPSEVMIAQRPSGSAPVVRGRAEELPFDDGSFDAVMAVLSDHHWTDRRRGFAELRRVARGRVVLFNANPGEADLFWLTTEYLPEFLELIPARYRDRGRGSRSCAPFSGRSTSCRCRSRTTARTASTGRTGGAPRRTSIQPSGRPSRYSHSSPRPPWTGPSTRWLPIWRTAGDTTNTARY